MKSKRTMEQHEWNERMEKAIDEEAQSEMEWKEKEKVRKALDDEYRENERIYTQRLSKLI
jgi:predicted secreted protein